MKHTLYILSLLVLCCATLKAEEHMPTGSWRTHFSYTFVDRIVSAHDMVYGVADGALLSVDALGEVRTYSRLTGLTGNHVASIFYLTAQGSLLVCYDDGNIDLIDSYGYVSNIPDLARKNLGVDKRIRDLASRGNTAYLATAFGIATINLAKMEFSDTYYIGADGASAVLSVAIVGDTIYALTDGELLRADVRSRQLMDYRTWQPTATPAGANRGLTALGSELYLLKADSVLYRLGPAGAVSVDSSVSAVWAEHGCLFARHGSGRLSASGRCVYNALPGDPLSAAYDGHNIWYSVYSGVARMNTATGGTDHFALSGPGSNLAWRVKYTSGRIMTVPGGRFSDNYFRSAYVSWFQDNRWSHIRGDDLIPDFPSHWVYDFVDVAADPADATHFFVAGYGIGLSEYRNDRLYRVHTCDNSGIETLYPDGNRYNYMRIDGLTYDRDGRLWMTNNGQAPIKILNPDGSWAALAHTGMQGVQTPQDILIDPNIPTRKYVLCPRNTDSNNSYLFVFDDHGTPADISDDDTRGFTYMHDQDGKQISFASSRLRSIAADRDGAIWVGTTEGLFTIRSRARIFESNFRCARVKISRNDGSNLADYLLGTEQVNAIAVDGANRKWFGTENGVFLTTADGTVTLLHFTEQNSPLLSNSVLSIAIDPVTGEVFFGTARGIISYQSDATEGSSTFDELHAYPNPVRPEYDGVVTITGLREGSTIKVADVNGYTVYETRANGGTATWPAQGVASGVYFVMCTARDGDRYGTCKVLIIK